MLFIFSRDPLPADEPPQSPGSLPHPGRAVPTGGSPDVVVSAEDHAALGVAGRADVPQLGLAAGALEAAAMPVAVHSVEQEAVGDLPPAAGAPLPREGARRHRGRLRAAAGVHHGLRESGAGQGRLGPGSVRSARRPARRRHSQRGRSSPGCVWLVGGERSARRVGKKKVAELVCQCRQSPGLAGRGRGLPQSGFFGSETRKRPEKTLRAEDAAPRPDR